jgi:hypothetical protein
MRPNLASHHAPSDDRSSCGDGVWFDFSTLKPLTKVSDTGAVFELIPTTYLDHPIFVSATVNRRTVVHFEILDTENSITAEDTTSGGR